MHRTILKKRSTAVGKQRRETAAIVKRPGFPPHTRVYEHLVAHIEHAIIQRRLRHGDRLPSERDLTSQFKVSRVAVREALRTLQLRGLLSVRKGPTGGYFVRHADSDVLRDGLRTLAVLGEFTIAHLAEVRISMEPEIARLAANQATEKHREDLAELLEARARANEKGEDVSSMDLEFHRMLGIATQNPLFASLLDSLMKLEVDLVVVKHEFGQHDHAEVDKAHREILQAILDRDGDAAAEAMRRHTTDLKHRKRES